jgi:hypothetical protein
VTTTADALEVMAIVAACHHRTAPRLDDREVALATAGVWAELFSVHNLALADLIAAVKTRAAAGHPDAPEPAELITFARARRRKRDAETGPTPEYEARCESKAEDRDELAANRQRRLDAPAIERPRIKELVAALAQQKGIESA